MILEHIQQMRTEGNKIFMPNYQTTRDEYAKIKKIMAGNHGKWSTKHGAFIFDYDPSEVLKQLQDGKEVNLKKQFQFFATPPEVVNTMFQITLPMYEEVTALEPHAGRADIIKGFNELGADQLEWDCIELNPINRVYLRENKYNLVHDDFLTFTTDKKYDLIAMNPPFKVDGDSYAWVDHFMKAFEFVHESSEIVCICPNSIEFSSRKKVKDLRDFLKSIDGQTYDLNKGSFKASGTMVSCKVIHICTGAMGEYFDQKNDVMIQGKLF